MFPPSFVVNTADKSAEEIAVSLSPLAWSLAVPASSRLTVACTHLRLNANFPGSYFPFKEIIAAAKETPEEQESMARYDAVMAKKDNVLQSVSPLASRSIQRRLAFPCRLCVLQFKGRVLRVLPHFQWGSPFTPRRD